MRLSAHSHSYPDEPLADVSQQRAGAEADQTPVDGLQSGLLPGRVSHSFGIGLAGEYGYDEDKKMAVELSLAKGSLKATAVELGITPHILTRWRRERVVTPGMNISGRAQLSQDQQEIQRLKKELKQAELDRVVEATR